MKKILKNLIKNPITIWLSWLKQQQSLTRRNPTLQFGYLSIAKGCRFGQYNVIFPEVKLVNCRLGNYSYIGNRSEIMNAEIGKFVSVAPGCRIGLGIHPISFISTHPVFYSQHSLWQNFPQNTQVETEEYQTIHIGNDVWIGVNAIIRDGITIGNGAVIAAGAVVVQNIPPYAIVGGVPARVIKYRFSPEEINKLEQMKWWDFSDEQLIRLQPLFCNPQTFLQHDQL